MTASIYKRLKRKDKVNQKTILHESIPITGSLLSGTYGTFPDDTNVKFYGHGMFQSVYDYPYLSSSANQMFDLTFGVRSGSSIEPSASSEDVAPKHNVYAQMSQLMFGYDPTGSFIPINVSGTLTPTTTEYMEHPYFLCFSRLLSKDGIKKGSFSIDIITASDWTSASDDHINPMVLSDVSGSTVYKTNSPLGEFSILYSGSATTAGNERGLVFYQAGIVVLDADKIFVAADEIASGSVYGEYARDDAIVSSSIDDIGDGLRHRIINVDFNNTTFLNSTVYFCRIGNSEFNYSSNPTYTTGSKLRVKTKEEDTPLTYITTVGLYSEDNELLAVAKTSEPIKKSALQEAIIRVRVDH
ncbi:MAG: hypothetical protein CL811_10280 [Colwelliaceae bacterium]|nr:hypothetical protein [Colwelliaceae bacterium]|tara:strand:+ start:191 stop:1258 length:1068 start_codon:yes stop_codon:yes gene_type:complete